MPLRAIARLIQTMLYAKRFFPYYVYNILGGIEEDGPSFLRSHIPISSPSFNSSGSGAVYSFDPVGSYEREACRAAGAAQSLVQPFLDNQASLLPSSSISSSFPCGFRPSIYQYGGIPVQNAYVTHRLHRSTSKIRSQHPEQHTQRTCHCLMCCPSLLIHSRVQPNVISK
jgi:hypothetical protein